MILNFTKKVQETADCFSFFFNSPEAVIFKAGQHMNFTLQHDTPDDRGVNRFFTIASAPHEGQVRVTTRIAPQQSSTFKTALMSMKTGGDISATPPQGKFTIDDYSKSYVFFAGGIGITPFRSILVNLDYIKKIKEMEIFLLYSNRSNDIVFKDELDLLVERNTSLKIRYVISPEVLNIEMLKAVVPDYRDTTYYISGPPGMVKSIGESLTADSIGDSQIKRDFFPGYL